MTDSEIKPSRTIPQQRSTTLAALRTSRPSRLTWLCIALLTTSASRAADRDGDDDLALAYGDAQTITITTGLRQPLSRAPAVATVITARDIQDMGATDLEQVLEAVPGLHVSHSTMGYAPIYAIRGISTKFNPQVLVLTNGIPMTSVFAGDRGMVWGGYPVDNISRIEVIRGPGSALYGADAYAGVINIITRTAAEISGSEAGVRAGSYRRGEGWAIHGRQWPNASLALYAGSGSSAGADGSIPADAQTRLDRLYGTHASLAPGRTWLGYRWTDAAIDLTSGNWQMRAALKERRAGENGAGIAEAVDPVGRNFGQRLTADLTYRRPQAAADWDLTVQASYFHLTEQSDLMLFPPGAFGGAFPDGMFGNPHKWERRSRVTATGDYLGHPGHRTRVGAGFEEIQLYRVEETTNYRYAYVEGIGMMPVPLGSIQRAPPDAVFMTPHDRRLAWLFVQDEWRLAPDWTLTSGIRTDHYSDFGTTTNPRLALVWESSYTTTVKLLANRAFRAPSFAELYNINNPVALGNPDLKPEGIATLEAAVNWRPSPTLMLSGNIFHFHMHDLIRPVANADPSTGFTSRNSGRQSGHGFELEGDWAATPALRLTGNYAFQRALAAESGNDAPAHHIYLTSRWTIDSHWQAYAQMNWIAGRNRQSGDSRPPIADYHTLDLGLRFRPHNGNWEAALAVRNALDADVREPSPAPGNLPGDLPMPGRNFSLQLRLWF
jgi:iron complex outermembrane receptor protein